MTSNCGNKEANMSVAVRCISEGRICVGLGANAHAREVSRMDLLRTGINLARQKKSQVIGSVLLLVLILIVPAAWAQMDTGTVTGVLHDEQGAVIANATVTIRNVDTGAAPPPKANDDGTYQAPGFSPGPHSSRAPAPAFRPANN